MKALRWTSYALAMLLGVGIYLYAWAAWAGERTQVDWTPATGPVVTYEVQIDGASVLTTPWPHASLELEDGQRVTVQALDAEGNRGPVSEPLVYDSSQVEGARDRCRADANRDGSVGLGDWGYVVARFGGVCP